MDGKLDCDDASDECPQNRYDIFSSNYNLIGNVGFRTLFWIVSCSAILANGVSIKKHIKKYVRYFSIRRSFSILLQACIQLLVKFNPKDVVT